MCWLPVTVCASCNAAGASSDSDEQASDSSVQEQRQAKRQRKQQSSGRPRRQRRRAAGQVDYRLLHEQLFGFSAFESVGDDIFKEEDDEDFEL